jgi:serine/threonine protein kinase
MRHSLEGLRYIHDTGYVHLDVKPENILINDEGEARVIDFTITERIGKFHFSVRKIRGSRSYIAPETIRRRPPTPQTDVYSLGCSFYEMLSGRTPFRADDPNQLLTKHLREQPPLIKNYVPNIHPLVDDLIQKMLAKKPGDRPTDCGAALEMLAPIDHPFL